MEAIKLNSVPKDLNRFKRTLDWRADQAKKHLDLICSATNQHVHRIERKEGGCAYVVSESDYQKLQEIKWKELQQVTARRLLEEVQEMESVEHV